MTRSEQSFVVELNTDIDIIHFFFSGSSKRKLLALFSALLHT